MLNTAKVSALLAQPLTLDPQLLSFVLMTKSGAALVSEIAATAACAELEFPIDVQVHDKIYAILMAKAWESQAPGTKWLGLTVADVKLAVFPAGQLLLLCVARPSYPWGLVQLLAGQMADTLAQGLGDFNLPE